MKKPFIIYNKKKIIEHFEKIFKINKLNINTIIIKKKDK